MKLDGLEMMSMKQYLDGSRECCGVRRNRELPMGGDLVSLEQGKVPYTPFVYKDYTHSWLAKEVDEAVCEGRIA